MTAEDDLSRRLKEIETERSSRRAERIAETFSPLALCHVCAALVVNPERHLEHHDAVDGTFRSHARAVEKAFRNSSADETGEEKTS